MSTEVQPKSFWIVGTPGSLLRCPDLSSVARFLVAFSLAALAFVSALRATSVVPPSFPELVKESEVIVRAKVKTVRCAWVQSPQGRVIKTYVTFEVLRRLKGEASAEVTLQFLGGELDGEAMHVAGMPQFIVGQTDIVFVSGNGVRFCPLVGMMHGRYRVQTDEAAKRDYVTRDDGVPLESEDDVQLKQDQGGVMSRFKHVVNALSPETFEQKIADEVTRRVATP